jgi:DNA-binding transcriptional LysR family regulator
MSRLAHLRTFLEVYRQKSFSKAANALGITQPAVSQQVQALEVLTGKPLFIRQSRGVVPTDVAEELAHSISGSIDLLEQKLTSFRFGKVVGGVVHMVVPADLLGQGYGQMLAPLTADGFTLRLQTGNRTKIYQLLEEQQVDFAIASSRLNTEHYEFVELTQEFPLIVFAPSLQSKIGKTLNEGVLKQLPVISYDEELSYFSPLWQKLFGHPPAMQAVITLPDMRAIKQLVLQGFGWSVLPDYHCTSELQNGSLFSLNSKQESISTPIYLVWHKHRQLSPSLHYVKSFILQQFGVKEQ